MSNLRALALNLIQLVEIQPNREVLIKDVEEVLQELMKETLQEAISFLDVCQVSGNDKVYGWYLAQEHLEEVLEDEEF